MSSPVTDRWSISVQCSHSIIVLEAAYQVNVEELSVPKVGLVAVEDEDGGELRETQSVCFVFIDSVTWIMEYSAMYLKTPKLVTKAQRPSFTRLRVG